MGQARRSSQPSAQLYPRSPRNPGFQAVIDVLPGSPRVCALSIGTSARLAWLDLRQAGQAWASGACALGGGGGGALATSTLGGARLVELLVHSVFGRFSSSSSTMLAKPLLASPIVCAISCISVASEAASLLGSLNLWYVGLKFTTPT